MISVEVLKGRPALETIAPEWEQLAGDTFTAAFSQPAWYMAWLDCFPARNIAVVTARENGQLVGILPLARNRTDFRGLFFRQTALIARGDYQPPLVVPGRTAEILSPMLSAAYNHYGKNGIFWWPNIPETDPSISLLRSFFTERGLAWTESSEFCPRVRLNGMDYEALEKSWSSKHRTDVRRRKKLLEKDHGPFHLWTPSSPEEGEPVLEEFFKVHDEKWLAQGWPGMFHIPENRRFFHAVLRRMWGKGVHFSTVRCGSVDISYQFGFFAGGWLQWYRPTYRPEYHTYSPSKLHVALVLEEGCRNAWQGLDFLLGDESYKFLWSHENMAAISFHAGRPWTPSYLWFSRGKPYVKDKLAARYMHAKAWLLNLGKKG